MGNSAVSSDATATSILSLGGKFTVYSAPR
jgi:hypothetical protein